MSEHKTPEQVVAGAIAEMNYGSADYGEIDTETFAEEANWAIDALRAEGMLAEGEPTEEQVERAARAYDPEAWATYDKIVDEAGEPSPELVVAYSIEKARVMLTAAGVAPQEPSAQVVIRGLDTDCATGICLGACSHLMWYCDRCTSEGGWGAPRDMLERWAAEHVCPTPPAQQGPRRCPECHRVEGHKMDCSGHTAPAPERDAKVRAETLREFTQGPINVSESGRADTSAPRVSADREKLIAEADGWVNAGLVHRHAMSALDTIRRLRGALAAQPVLDFEKVAEVVNRTRTQLGSELASVHQTALALCEAAKRGELA